MEHQAGEDDEMQPFCAVGRSASPATEPRRPQGKRASRHPATRQQHTPTLDGIELDNLEPDAMGGRIFGSRRTDIALIDEGDFDVFARHRLDRFGQFGKLTPLFGIGRGHLQGEKMRKCIDSDTLRLVRPVAISILVELRSPK